MTAAAWWLFEHPWHVAAGVLVWTVTSAVVAVVAGRMIAEGDR